ncbi:EI24 domain-containing protein [Erythrobacter sp. Alg231-14]|uniref:EI24 domain-containing protein n=1 Tax=Erythrobacter sp. Alg231-14 TaxID=1922225 RepID=UPI000D55F7B3
MNVVIEALVKAFRQLSDRAVLSILFKSMLVTLFVFICAGVAVYYGLIWVGTSYAGDSSGFAEAALAVIIAGLAFWFLFRVVAVGVLQFFADEVVAAVEARHYPDLAKRAQPLPFRRDLSNSLRGMGRTIGANLLALPVAGLLLVTGIGPAIVFLAVNAWLLGRELTDMAWLRHCGDREADNPVPRFQRVTLGAIVAGVMVIPFANLIGPIVGAAAGTHLAHHAMSAKRSNDERGDTA